MDFTRARGTDWLTGLGGLLLLVALFLPWYDTEGLVSTSGWESLSVIDLVLALFGAGALALPFVTAARESAAVPLVVNVITLGVGVFAILLVVIRVIWIPSSLGTGVDLPGVSNAVGDVTRQWGLFVGLVATVGTFYTAYRALRDVRAPGVAPAPTPARMPAPPAAG